MIHGVPGSADPDLIMEILRQRGVRLIAINDGVDSARGDDDFTPFRNIMNEYRIGF